MTVELPKTYGSNVRNALQASPTTVDFKSLCPYFFAFGAKLLELVVDIQLPSVLEKVTTQTIHGYAIDASFF
jgi:GINS complex subunit 3